MVLLVADAARQWHVVDGPVAVHLLKISWVDRTRTWGILHASLDHIGPELLLLTINLCNMGLGPHLVNKHIPTDLLLLILYILVDLDLVQPILHNGLSNAVVSLTLYQR